MESRSDSAALCTEEEAPLRKRDPSDRGALSQKDGPSVTLRGKGFFQF